MDQQTFQAPETTDRPPQQIRPVMDVIAPRPAPAQQPTPAPFVPAQPPVAQPQPAPVAPAPVPVTTQSAPVVAPQPALSNNPTPALPDIDPVALLAANNLTKPAKSSNRAQHIVMFVLLGVVVLLIIGLYAYLQTFTK